MVVVVFHDHGSRYLGKMFNDDWMREKGFLEKTGLTARDLVASRRRSPLATIDRRDHVSRALQMMTEHDYSQIRHRRRPHRRLGQRAASLRGDRQDPEVKRRPIEDIMQMAPPFVDISTGIDALATMITPEMPAVLVRDFKTVDTFIITRWDVMQAISVRTGVKSAVGTTGTTGPRNGRRVSFFLYRLTPARS